MPMRAEDVHYCPRCAAPVVLQVKFGRERPVCPSCGWIFFADPKVAAAVLVEQDGKVLLVRRVNEPFRGLWTLPAGFVNADEDPAQAAIRECLEETGLEVTLCGILDIRHGREHERGADFVIFYRGQVRGGLLRAGDDADAAAWFAINGLPELAFQSTRYILARHSSHVENISKSF
ncbi:MAG: NUDIX hydrolase [Anaerolineales bacterium]|nr:NUDIX hydrolase [Anaerolineales bacterium]